MNAIKKYEKWGNAKIKKLDIWDMKLVKWGMLFFTLALAKLFPVILSLDWYWYGIAAALAFARPLSKYLA